MDTHHFTVSEVFPDGRVLIVIYVRVGRRLRIIMDVYNDMTLQEGKRYLNLDMDNQMAIVPLG